ncbi:MAG: hypothetical protein Q4P33_03580 [Flaviflexus sp.]|nr:hypothetical protein [Flaviflexus sp.]
MIIPAFEGLTLSKGHAAGSDYIIVPDLDAGRTIVGEDVATLCARYTGMDAGGLMRISGRGPWRLEVWNDRGEQMVQPEAASLLLAAHYLAASLLSIDPVITFETASGTRTVAMVTGGYCVSLPAPVIDPAAQERAFDRAVSVPGVDGDRAGLSAGSHVVVALRQGGELLDAELAGIQIDPADDRPVALVHPYGSDAVADIDGKRRRRNLARVRALTNTIEALGATAAALAAWAGPAISRLDIAGSQWEVRLLGDTVEVTGRPVLISEFMLTGLAGEAMPGQ